MQAAIDLFAQQGYVSVGIDDIGAAVGITGPGIYRHFPSKEAILEAVFDHAAEKIGEQIQHAMDSSPTPEEALGNLVRHAIDTIARHPSLLAVTIGERRYLGPKARAKFDRIRRLRIEEWAHPLTLLRPDLADEDARLIVYLTQAMLLSWLGYHSALSDERQTNILFSLAMAMMLHAQPESSDTMAEAMHTGH